MIYDNMDIVFCQGTAYHVRTVTTHSFGTVNVSTESLNDKLFDKDGDYVSAKAQFIDEYIFFYVENDVIHMQDEDLKAYLEKSVM